MVEEIVQKKPSHSWWFKGHSTPKRSPWLQSTLSELDKKTTAMLKLIEEDAESFAQRAEMYYKKRPELINMVEDFYRTHRSLAERFDLLKIESKTRSSIYQPNKISTTDMVEKPYDSYSDKSEMYPESEVDDPEEVEQEETHVHKQLEDDFEGDDGLGESEVDDHEEEEEEETRVHEGIEDNLEDDEGLGKSEVDDSEENEEEKETQIHNLTKDEENEVSNGKNNENEVVKLREELEKLKEENKVQREQLMQKDEEKREAIRQLSLSMEFLRENLKSSKNAIKESYNMKKNQFDLHKLKELISGKLFGGGSSKTSTNLVAL